MFLQIFVPVLFAVSARLAQGALRGVGYEELSFTTVFADLTSTANAKSGKSMPWLDKLKTMTKLKDASFEACARPCSTARAFDARGERTLRFGETKASLQRG